MKEFLSKIDYSILGFCLFVARVTILGTSMSDAIAMFAIAGLYGTKEWLKQQEVKRYNEKFEQDVRVEFQKASEEIGKIKGVMGAINLGTTYNSALRKVNPQ